MPVIPNRKIINNIVCADVLKGMKLLTNRSVHLIITSPPYNINIGSRTRCQKLGIEYDKHADNMNMRDYYTWMKKVWKESKRILVKGGRLCINSGIAWNEEGRIPIFSRFIQQCLKLGFLYRGMVTWHKFPSRKRDVGTWCSPLNPLFVSDAEYITVFSKDQMQLVGDKSLIDLKEQDHIDSNKKVWTFKPEMRRFLYEKHPAPFPEELPRRLIHFLSYKGNTVLDMFAGTGTVGIVAKRTGRNFILIDHSKKYCNIALQRIEREFCFNKKVHSRIITV